MSKRKVLGAAAVVLSLAGGGAAGALLGTPSLGLAHESGSQAHTQAGGGDGDGRVGAAHRPGHHHKAALLEAAAEALGLEVDELRDRLRDGATIAEVAGDEGVDVQAVIDALVTAVAERIDEAVADGRLDAEEAEEKKAQLPARMEALVNGELGHGPGRHGHGPRGHHGSRFGALLSTAAEVLGMDVDELRRQLRDGATIAEIAEQQAVDVQTIIDALVAEATERIDARTAEIKESLPERAESFVNGERPDRHGDEGDGRDGAGG